MHIMSSIEGTGQLEAGNDISVPSLTSKIRNVLGGYRQRVAEARTVPANDPLKPLFLRNLRYPRAEGSMSLGQAKWLRDFYQNNEDIKQILEIGFNLGHSAVNALTSRPDIAVDSVDIGEHDYIEATAKYVQRRFPHRHKLIIGNSTDVIPALAATGEKYDSVYVDGGHDYETAKADLLNCRRLAHDGTALILDDYMPERHWGVGPYRAWNELVADGLIQQDGIIESQNRRWAIGHYATRNS